MISKHSLFLACAAVFVSCGKGSYAASIVNGFDLDAFSFDVADFGAAGQFIDAPASGTSGGVAFTISQTVYWSVRTKTDGSFVSSALGGKHIDNLHPGGDYTITFAQPIQTLIVALSNDNLTDSINFGLIPSFTQGVSFSGTQAVLDSAAGGVVFFENINSLVVQNVNNNGSDDGYDLAFHAIAVTAVPDAGSTLAALGGVLGLFTFVGRRFCRR